MKAEEKVLKPNVTQIQKWLYICYGLYFAAYGKQLLDERPKAWDYGPAFPKVHKKQKKYGDSLRSLYEDISADELNEYDEIIKPVLAKFGPWTATQLVDWTHEDGMAWDKKIKLGENMAL